MLVSAADRGVSDLLAFVLTFSIIITGIGIVSVGAYGSLGEYADREQVDGAERGLVAGATVLDDIHREDDLRRSFTLGLSDGFVYLNESTVEVTVNGTGATMSAHNALEHRFDPQGAGPVSIAYEAGGIFRSNAVGARYDPSIGCSAETNTAVVSLVNLTTTDSIAVSEGYSQQTVLNPNALSLPQDAPVGVTEQTLSFDARLVGVNTTTLDTSTNVTIDVGDSASPTRWGEYLDETGWNGSGSTWECSAETVVVRVTTIELSV